MGFLDRLLGREDPRSGSTQPQNAADARPAAAPNAAFPSATPGAPRSEDEIAVERYRYLLRTAPPETIEQVHEEAFAKLTPEQRRLLFQQLSESAPAGEQPRGDDPRSLAQAATRSELRQPGTLERALGGGRGAGFGGAGGGGMGFGGMFASSLLGSVAGYVIGSALVGAFLPSPADQQADGSAGDQNADSQSATDQNANDQGGDAGSGTDSASGGDGSVDAAGWDAGGSSTSDWAGGGDWTGGGDWGGGGDFGGGDFGGGDFI
jgi:hypothetical protein